METFFDGYVTAALWLTDENPGAGEWAQHDEYTVSNIAPETLEQMRADCEKFESDYGDLLYHAVNSETIFYTDKRAGVDFWLTRNGHGAGFWDRDLGEIGDKLTDAAHAFGEYDLYIGDDGQIYGG